MRIRSTDTRDVTTLSNTASYCNGTHSTTYSDLGDSGVVHGETTRVADVVIKNYAERSARGEIFNNPFDLEKTTYDDTSHYDWEHHFTGTCSGANIIAREGNSYAGDVPLRLEFEPDGMVQTLHILAGTQAWGNVVSPEVMGGENVHDLEQTWRMLAHPLEGFHQFLHKVRSTRSFKRQLLSLGEFISDSWLQYRYGATPLVHDVMNGFHAAVVPVFTDRHTARGSASAPLLEEEDSVAVTDGSRTGTCVRKSTGERWVRAGVLYRHHFTVGDRWGSSAHNILPTLWEIFPYSFVADWFVNVGDFLAACTPKANVEVLASWSTYHGVYNYYRDIQVPHTSTDPQWAASGTSGFADHKERKHVVRRPYASKGVTLRSNDWTFSKSKNWLHFADGMALAGQYLRRKPSAPPPRTVRKRPWNSYKPWTSRPGFGV